MKLRFSLLIAATLIRPVSTLAELTCPSEVTIGCTTGLCGDRVRDAIRAVVPTSTRIIWKSLPRLDLESETIDGVISPGGKDLVLDAYLDRIPEAEQKTYVSLDHQKGKHTPASINRDQFELKFWKSYFTSKQYRHVAALGICYGHQVMAVTNGFSLYSDLRSQLGIPARYSVEDSISFPVPFFDSTPEPFLAREEHHQAVRKLGTSQEKGQIFATSNRGKIIEGIRYDGRPAYSVQFHPEISRLEVRVATLLPFVQALCDR